MITLDQALEIIHASSLTQRDTLLVLMATDLENMLMPAAIKALGKSAGVKGIANWNISILGNSKGQAVPNGKAWTLTPRGRNRVMELAQGAGINITIKPVESNGANSISIETNSMSPKGRVFIGHGGSPVWKDLREFLDRKLELQHDEFNRIPTAGMTNIERLEQMLRESVFAFIVLTAEDEQRDGKLRARQNVIHEAGLFQGRHGFKRAIILLEDGCDEFSNIHGLTQIRFPKGKIIAVAEEIRDVLIREGVLN